LRAFILNFKGLWEEHLHLVEFSYNNSYQASIYIKMALFEALLEGSVDHLSAGMNSEKGDIWDPT